MKEKTKFWLTLHIKCQICVQWRRNATAFCRKKRVFKSIRENILKNKYDGFQEF